MPKTPKKQDIPASGFAHSPKSGTVLHCWCRKMAFLPVLSVKNASFFQVEFQRAALKAQGLRSSGVAGAGGQGSLPVMDKASNLKGVSAGAGQQHSPASSLKLQLTTKFREPSWWGPTASCCTQVTAKRRSP